MITTFTLPLLPLLPWPEPLGASIQTYLLEKVRLPNQSENERNFHIFYQMCAGATEEEKQRLRLDDIRDYYFTNQGNCYTLRHVDDRDEFEHLLKAMRVLGFSEETIADILSLVAGLLHMGQVRW